MKTRTERISMRKLETYARLLGRGSIAAKALQDYRMAKDQNLKPVAYMTNNGFVIEAMGDRVSYG